MKKQGIKLRVLISVLIFFVIVTTSTFDSIISMNLYKKTTTDLHLESNFNYANKLRTTAHHQFNYMKNNLTALGKMIGEGDFTQEKLNEWAMANQNHFQMLFVTDEIGRIQLSSPRMEDEFGHSVTYFGSEIENEMVQQALKAEEAMISEPYYGIKNRLKILVSAPIINEETKERSGIIVGAIHLEDNNVLHCIFRNHRHSDETYVYVVDRNGSLIYHPEVSRLGEDVSDNEVVQQVMQGESGKKIVVNTKDSEFFASYTTLEMTGWGIVVQTYSEVVNEPLSELLIKIILISIPILLIILFISGFIVSTITKPINQLASFSEKLMNNKHLEKDVEQLTIQSSIYEVRQLYSQVVNHLQTLDKTTKVDGLTRLLNRATFDTLIKRWLNRGDTFSFIMLDIDFFKRVNDTYGHLVGDDVLKFLAKEIEQFFGVKGSCFRYGGEEFVILLKDRDEEEAYHLAEAFRKRIEKLDSPTGEPIHISLGVTDRRHTDADVNEIIDRADAALYESKNTGRNKVTVFQDK